MMMKHPNHGLHDSKYKIRASSCKVSRNQRSISCKHAQGHAKPSKL